MEQVPRKGMSKGCLIALIIVGALIVLLIVLFAIIFAKREAMVKWGNKSSMDMIKIELAKNPPAGVDTARFDAIVDSFVVRVSRDSLDFTRYSMFVPVLQKVMEDRKIDGTEVGDLTDAIVKYYPDLEPIATGVTQPPANAPADTSRPVDTGITGQ